MQSVGMDERERDILPVQTGVPQGAVLGRFILININDIPDS